MSNNALLTEKQTLAFLKKGEHATIIGYFPSENEDQQYISKRLLELGFIPGEKISVIAEAFPGKDPIAVRVGTLTFALRRYEASMIHIIRE